MNLRFVDDIATYTEDDFSKMLVRLPEWRRKKALSYHFLTDRILCAKAFLLLQEQLEACFDITGELEFEYNKNGKPALKGRNDIYFNLSHCKKGILSVVDKFPVGCDIEEFPAKLNMSVCNYSFNEKELNEILSSDNPCMEFARYWTMKESFVKLTGQGISEKLPQLFSDDLFTRLNFETVIRQDKGYAYSVCHWK